MNETDLDQMHLVPPLIRAKFRVLRHYLHVANNQLYLYILVPHCELGYTYLCPLVDFVKQSDCLTHVSRCCVACSAAADSESSACARVPGEIMRVHGMVLPEARCFRPTASASSRATRW